MYLRTFCWTIMVTMILSSVCGMKTGEENETNNEDKKRQIKTYSDHTVSLPQDSVLNNKDIFEDDHQNPSGEQSSLRIRNLDESYNEGSSPRTGYYSDGNMERSSAQICNLGDSYDERSFHHIGNLGDSYNERSSPRICNLDDSYNERSSPLICNLGDSYNERSSPRICNLGDSYNERSSPRICNLGDSYNERSSPRICNLGDSYTERSSPRIGYLDDSFNIRSSPRIGIFDDSFVEFEDNQNDGRNSVYDNIKELVYDFDIESNADESILNNKHARVLTSTPLKRRRTLRDLSSDEETDFRQPLSVTSVESNYIYEAIPIPTVSDDSIYSDVSNGEANIYHDVRATFPNSASKPLLDAQSCPEKSRLLAKHTRVANIQKDMKRCLECCSRVCSSKFTIIEIKNLRMEFWAKTVNGRKQWLMNKFDQTDMTSAPNFSIKNGITVCCKSLMGIFGFNKNFYYSTRKMFFRGTRFSVKERHHGVSMKFLQSINWMEEYATFYSDRMPDSHVLLLPYRTRQCMIYMRYKEDMIERKEHHLMPSAFYKMWKKHFPNLKIKQTNSFSKCTLCTSLERQIETTHDPILREKLRAERREHNNNQMLERKYYYSKKNAAKTSPSQFLSLIIDGMDQSKTNLPHFVGRMAKAVNPVDQLTTHVTGVLAHGQNKFFTFLDWNQYAHDSNLTMNILLMILYQISKLMGNKLPPVLYLQADNCWRENKNKYVLSFCELLVHQRIFNEVHLSFLPVGHTHEDVDAAFSKIAEKLRRNDAETLPRLKTMLPNTNEIEVIYDIRSWLTPHLNDIRKHTTPLHYKFTRDLVSQTVSMEYKSSHNKEWKKENGGLINANQDGKINLPKGIPNIVLPKFDKIDIDRIKTRIPQWQCLFTDQIDHSEKRWWEQYLDHLNNIKNSPQYRRSKILSKAKWLLPLLPKQRPHGSNERQGENDPEIPADIQRMLENEREDCEVELRQKKPKKTKSKPNSSGNTRNNGPKTKKTVLRTVSYVYFYRSSDGHNRKHILLLIILFLLEALYMYIIWLNACMNITTYHYYLFMFLWSVIIDLHVMHMCAKVNLEFLTDAYIYESVSPTMIA